MATYIVTGGTGFLGRAVLPLILERDDTAKVHVLIRSGSVDKLEAQTSRMRGADRVHPLIGDLTEPGLGIDSPPAADHVLHLGAIYDITAGDEQATTNIEGTRSVVELAATLGATLHHVSSIAVAGDFRGKFAETDFDRGQSFPTPYHRTKFEAEKLVREREGLSWRVYRPSAVVGNSVTGEMDKIDGPYYMFPSLALLAKLPAALPVPIPDLGATNVVPVDFVAAALVELMHQPGRDGRVFHLVNPTPQPVREIYAGLAKAAGAPFPAFDVPGALAAPFLSALPIASAERVRKVLLDRIGLPAVLLDNITMAPTFTAVETRAALEGTGIEAPPFGSYAAALWRYWQKNLDPNRARRTHPDGALVGRNIVITGASSGIGRASATAAAAKGATVLLLARRAGELDDVVASIRAAGGKAHGYPCDITDGDSVDSTVKSILAEHDHVDMLVNNAGRSIRRGIYNSTDRLHDYERTMAVNYFGAVRLVLAFLPTMRARRFGHIVNISSAGVQAASPRFSAYVASKAALDGFSDVAASETLSDGITFTTIHMPLVQTPMIAPTGSYNPGPITSVHTAAAMVIRALVERPKRIDVPVGTLADLGHRFAPRTKDLVLNQMYRAFPDSPAARGEVDTRLPAVEPVTATPHSRSLFVTIGRKAARLVPGTFW
ncbi:NAD(P)-dependent dehydrogenase (short-subunit alcohol dehydrogenase family) [Rhodococcus sp. 27YEA15]|uniref:SDR family oxidoreductase n=1 Tax=Rhodococcus sp. 27YEA15 TaxID=3156259 RepID=UPI003C7A00D3